MSPYTTGRLTESPEVKGAVAAKAGDDAKFVTTTSHAAADPFGLLVEAVKDYGIFMLDPAGNVSSWNPGAEKTVISLSRAATCPAK